MPDPKQGLSVTEQMAQLLASFGDLGNLARYGVTADDKYRMALSGQIPGAQPVINNAQVPIEERRAAGYLFGQRWPTVGVPLTKLAGLVRSPFEDPALGQVAVQAAQQGAHSAEARAQAERAMMEQRIQEFARQYALRMQR